MYKSVFPLFLFIGFIRIILWEHPFACIDIKMGTQIYCSQNRTDILIISFPNFVLFFYPPFCCIKSLLIVTKSLELTIEAIPVCLYPNILQI